MGLKIQANLLHTSSLLLMYCRKADRLEARMREISAENRRRLEEHSQQAAAAKGDVSSTAVIPRLEFRPEVNQLDQSSRLMTGVGAVVTTRLAQQMLAEYCAKLPGSDRWVQQGWLSKNTWAYALPPGVPLA